MTWQISQNDMSNPRGNPFTPSTTPLHPHPNEAMAAQAAILIFFSNCIWSILAETLIRQNITDAGITLALCLAND